MASGQRSVWLVTLGGWHTHRHEQKEGPSGVQALQQPDGPAGGGGRGQDQLRLPPLGQHQERVQQPGAEILQRLPAVLPPVPTERNVPQQAQLEALLLLGILGNLLLSCQRLRHDHTAHFLRVTGQKTTLCV